MKPNVDPGGHRKREDPSGLNFNIKKMLNQQKMAALLYVNYKKTHF